MKTETLLVASLTVLLLGCVGTKTLSKSNNVSDTGKTKSTTSEMKACVDIRFLEKATIDSEKGYITPHGLSVHPGNNGELAEVDVTCIYATGNYENLAITVKQLEEFSPISGLKWGISIDNKLLLVKENGPSLQVLKDKQGNYDVSRLNIKSYRGIEELLKTGYVLVPVKKMEDGRINVASDKGSSKATKQDKP